MNEGLTLLGISGMDARQMGATLAICSRAQGSTVLSIVTNLQNSAENGSDLARHTIAAYRAADQALQHMAATTTTKHHG